MNRYPIKYLIRRDRIRKFAKTFELTSHFGQLSVSFETGGVRLMTYAPSMSEYVEVQFGNSFFDTCRLEREMNSKSFAVANSKDISQMFKNVSSINRCLFLVEMISEPMEQHKQEMEDDEEEGEIDEFAFQGRDKSIIQERTKIQREPTYNLCFIFDCKNSLTKKFKFPIQANDVESPLDGGRKYYFSFYQFDPTLFTQVLSNISTKFFTFEKKVDGLKFSSYYSRIDLQNAKDDTKSSTELKMDNLVTHGHNYLNVIRDLKLDGGFSDSSGNFGKQLNDILQNPRTICDNPTLYKSPYASQIRNIMKENNINSQEPVSERYEEHKRNMSQGDQKKNLKMFPDLDPPEIPYNVNFNLQSIKYFLEFCKTLNTACDVFTKVNGVPCIFKSSIYSEETHIKATLLSQTGIQEEDDDDEDDDDEMEITMASPHASANSNGFSSIASFSSAQSLRDRINSRRASQSQSQKRKRVIASDSSSSSDSQEEESYLEKVRPKKKRRKIEDKPLQGSDW